MSLASLYNSFLASPSPASLADDATLQYITTLTNIKDARSIVKHLTSQQLKRKSEKIIDHVEGNDALFAEIETTIEFVSSGGAYLPGLDDNFLSDRIVTFPVTHVVRFNSLQKIQQIRLSWDQGSLLKALEVIGARGRNWPIRDGRDQAKMIFTSVRSLEGPGASDDSHAAGNANGRKTATKDPHASLSLFGPRESYPESQTEPSGITPSSSAKPPQRAYDELFVGSQNEASPSIPSKGRSFAGGQRSMDLPIHSKAGAGSSNEPSRHFDRVENPQDETPRPSPSKKNDHFEFGDGSEEGLLTVVPQPKARSNKHGSHWDFEDFVTPQKPNAKVRSNDVRHFGWSDDEVSDTPAKEKKPAQPRRDAEHHFEFRDDGTPMNQRKVDPRAKGTALNSGLGLYQNNIYDEDGDSEKTPKKSQPLGNLTNVKNHRKYFDDHFSMADDSPASTEDTVQRKPPAADHKAAVKMMGSSWDTYDESPQQSKKENVEKSQTSGNGERPVPSHGASNSVGGKRAMAVNWGFGDEEENAENTHVSHDSRPTSSSRQTNITGGSFWDF